MGTLALVRHGQASFFDSDYDKLSALGEEQARRLGAHWAALGVRVDEVWSGSLKRQTRTAELVGECFAAAGLPWPELRVSPAFNEYDADGVMKSLLPALERDDERFAELSRALAASVEPKGRYRNFHRLLDAVMARWQAGEAGAGGFETWAEFSSRVREGLRRATESREGGRRVAVFTSGGPIGVAVQTAMAAPDPKALDVNWRVRNASVNEFAFSAGRLTLDAFNGIAHLTDPKMWTYR